MQTYELLAVLPAGQTEEEVKLAVEKIREIFAANSAEVVDEGSLGVFKFAYPISKERHGAYHLFVFNADSGTVEKLRSAMALAGIALRFNIMKAEADAKKRKFFVEEYEVPNRERRMRRTRRKTPAAALRAPAVPRAGSAPASAELAPKLQPAKKPMSEEEIEAQIDKILEEKII